jgi:hypothetical protein
VQLALLIRIALGTRFPFFDATRNATLNFQLPLLRITLLLLYFFFHKLLQSGWEEREPYHDDYPPEEKKEVDEPVRLRPDKIPPAIRTRDIAEPDFEV